MKGCNYVVSTKKIYNIKKKQYDDVKVFCDKLVAEGLEVCPKHKLFLEDAKEEPKRKEAARILNRNLKTLEQEALENSPLRAENPEFQEKKIAAWVKGGYGI